MKRIFQLILALLACIVSPSSNAETPPVISSDNARIVGGLPDGTPPPSAPPEPEFTVPTEDIIKTEVHEQEGRTITVQEIAPIDLPATTPGLEPSAETAAATNPEFLQRLKEYRAAHPVAQMIRLGATIYRSSRSAPRTLAKLGPLDGGEPVTFWSSADFSFLSGVNSFIGSDNAPRTLMMTWSPIYLDRPLGAKRAGLNLEDIPTFPVGNATFVISGAPPSADALLAIKSLHDLYNNEHDRLQTALEAREQARLAREAELRANPPQLQDITINHWRIEPVTPANEQQGGEQ